MIELAEAAALTIGIINKELAVAVAFVMEEEIFACGITVPQEAVAETLVIDVLT